jgi:predicted DsbA family dithiol-disulfide isomerase
LKATYGIEVRFRHFPLHPDTPDEGLTLQELFAGRNIDIPAAQRRMVGLMEQEGLPYGKRTHTFNSRLAQELATWAETQPGGSAIHDALFRAYFVDGQNLASKAVLLSVVKRIGLSIEDATDVLADRKFRERVDADWALSRQYQITGVPTFVADGRGVSGAQPYEVLEQLVTAAGASPG